MSKKGEEARRYYWDSCVFLSAINKNADRLDVIDNILDDCERGKAEIYTSILTITEVAYAQPEKTSTVLDATIQAKIDRLWLPPSPIKLIEIHELIIWDARDLIRKSLDMNQGLKPADAIHLATANRLPIDAVHTYDNKLMKYGALVKFAIQEPIITDRFVFPADSRENTQETESSQDVH